MEHLLYAFLEEILFLFATDPYLALKRVEIQDMMSGPSCFQLSATCFGEEYSRPKHGSKTEIKSVTYSNMIIKQKSDSHVWDIYAIVDI